jgi:hypothetical protein
MSEAQGIGAEFFRRTEKIGADSPVFCGFAAKNAQKDLEKTLILSSIFILNFGIILSLFSGRFLFLGLNGSLAYGKRDYTVNNINKR